MATGASSSSTSALERFWCTVKDSVYETVYLVAKDTEIKSWWYMLVSFVEFLQLLAFPLQLLVSATSNAEEASVFVDNFLSWIGMTGNSFNKLSDEVSLAIYAATCAWILIFIGFTALTGYQSRANSSKMSSSVRYLRTIAHLSSTLLFIPIVSVLFRTYDCNTGGSWVVTPSISCYHGLHIGVALTMPLVVFAFSVLCLFKVAVAFERNIKSTQLDAKVHGRGDVLLLLNKLILVFIFTILWKSIDRWFAQLVVLASAVVYLGNYMVYQPHVRFEVNSGKSALAAAYLFATITSLVILLDSRISFSMLLLFGIPLAALAGYMGSQLRQTIILRKSLEDLRNYHEISVWARKHIEVYENAKNSHRQTELSFDIDMDENTATENEGLLESKQLSDMETRLEAIKQQVELAYRTCMDKFPSNGTALLEAASFFRNYRDNLFMEMMTLNLAKRNARAVDIQFVISQRLRELREDDQRNNDGDTMGAVDRVLFDQHYNDASNLETKCYKLIYQFWMVISRKLPDIAQLQVLAEELTRTADEVEMHYEECLKLNSDSVVALRSFGVFLSKVKVEQERSAEFLAKADRIEDQVGKQKKKQIAKFSFDQKLNAMERTDESAGVVIISGDRMVMGQILEVNTEACRILGRPKDELIGNNVNTIIPKPFSLVHDIYLRRFARTGISKIVNTNRSLLAIDGSAALIPLILNFREIPPDVNDESASPRVSAFIRSPKTEEHFMLFDGQSNGYKILHADTLTLSKVMGMTAQQLNETEVSAADYLSDLKAFGETDDDSVSSWESSENHEGSKRVLQIKSAEQSRKNLKKAASNPNGMSLVDTSLGLGGELFLQSLEQSGEYSKINFENVADEEVQKVEARIQTIPVSDYGTVFLLAWKIPASRKRKQKKHTEQKQQNTRRETEKEEQATGSFIVSSSSCPFSKSMASRSMDKTSFPHPFESDSSSVEHTETKGHVPLSLVVPTRSASNQDEIPEVGRILSQSQSDNEERDLTDRSPFPHALKPEGKSTQNQDVTDSFTEGSQKRKRADGRASSVGTSAASVTRMIQTVVGNTSTGMKPLILKLQCILIASMVVFVALTVTVPTVLDSRYTTFHEQAQSAETAASEMVHFDETKTILAKLHITNSPFEKAVESQTSLWSFFKEVVQTYSNQMDLSRSSIITVGGEARDKELTTHFEMTDTQNADSETLSIDEIRDYMHSHLHALTSGANVSVAQQFLPGNTTRHAVLILDNAEKYTKAINDSTKTRISVLSEATVNLQEQLAIILACVSVLGLIFVLGMVVYLLSMINTSRNNILTTFLYIPQASAKLIAGVAAQSLKEHIEKVTKSDLGENNDSDDDSLSLASGTEADENADGSDRMPQKEAHLNDKSKVTSDDYLRRGSAGSIGSGVKKFRKGSGSGIMSEVREHTNTSKFMIKSLTHVALPLIPFIVWVVFFAVDASLIMRDIREEVGRSYEIEQTVVDLIDYQRNLHSLAFRVTLPDTALGTASLQVREGYENNLRMLSRSILRRVDKVIHGGKSIGGDDINGYENSRLERGVFVEDACIILEGKIASRCEDTPLAEGFQNFLREFLNDGSHILSELPSLYVGNAEALDKLAKDTSLQKKIQRLNSIDIAVQIGTQLAKRAIQSSVDEMDESMAHQQITTVFCSVFFILTTIIVSRPTVNQAGKSLMASFQSLVLIPEEVLASNRHLRKKMKTLTGAISSSKGVDDSSSAVLLAAEMHGSPKKRNSRR